ncbi:MAG TPA: hypothetical protein DEP91_04715 [Sphingomonas bacterium]|jgi:hypothetical protein|uniref:Uncharacterized protein n=1 Tax=Sphingomonas bacterium TaxID=1895847 RepID=A0A3D0WBV7_9SPHN|nr:hypothetical protein [Sphingomonas bacterium]
MAYLAFAEVAAGSAASPAPASFRAKPAFSPLEWSVVALARRDKVASLREPGRVAVAMGVLFGERPNPRLADPRLEALRRMAVLSWRHGYEVDTSEIRRFVDAGYDLRQYELMVDSIAADKARAAGTRRAA